MSTHRQEQMPNCRKSARRRHFILPLWVHMAHNFTMVNRLLTLSAKIGAVRNFTSHFGYEIFIFMKKVIKYDEKIKDRAF